MATISVTDDNFDTEVIKAGKPVIVDFGLNGVDSPLGFSRGTIDTKN